MFFVRECTRDRRQPCIPFNERASDQSHRPVVPPKQIQGEADLKKRKKRHFQTFTRGLPINSARLATTTEYPSGGWSDREQDTGGNQFGRESGDRTSNGQAGNYWGNDGTSSFGQPDSSGQNGKSPGNGYESGRRPNWDTSSNIPTTARSPSSKGTQGGYAGSRPTSEKLPPAQSSVLPAYAGWPQPMCNREAGKRYPFKLGNNTIILSDVRKENQGKKTATKANCGNIRWDRRDLPYETIVSQVKKINAMYIYAYFGFFCYYD